MHRRLFLKGAWLDSETKEIKTPWDGRVFATVAQAQNQHVEDALSFAFESRRRLRLLSTGHRRGVMDRMAQALSSRAKEFEEVICHEAGKPITYARLEVKRAIETFSLAGDWLSSFGSLTVPVDTVPSNQGLECEVRRFPAGVVVGIVPFNFPLNLGAHKVAPAMAVGAPIIVKPPPQAPSAMLMIAQIAQECGADPAALQVLPCDNAVAERLATDSRVRVLSFTGSSRVGFNLKAKAAGKVVLELGGNAAAIVTADADLKRAAQRLATSAFAYAGQVCIKVQRIIVEAPVADAFRREFEAAAAALGVGDPSQESTVVGPLIDDAAGERISAWVSEAGGTVERSGRLMSPLIMDNVPKQSRLYREEVFGPVVLLETADTFETALGAANDSAYGLQAAVFTNSLAKARGAFHELEVGGVVLNDAPSLRSDNQPYGGVKSSGLGREGIRYAMEDYTEERVLLTAASGS